MRGNLFVGSIVEVLGTVDPDLSVSARRISVVRPLEAVPDEVRLDFVQSHRIDLVLDQVLGTDLPLSIQSQDPQIAFAAGSSQQEVSIRAGSREGRVRYQAEAPFSLGGDVDDLKIQIEN